VDNDTVAADGTKLTLDIEIEANTRRAVDGELLTPFGLVALDLLPPPDVGAEVLVMVRSLTSGRSASRLLLSRLQDVDLVGRREVHQVHRTGCGLFDEKFDCLQPDGVLDLVPAGLVVRGHPDEVGY
jgi:hypothetical protein